MSTNSSLQLASAFILSRLDYSNVVLSSLPKSTIAPPQRVENAAETRVFSLHPNDHIFSALLQFHWLPVDFWIKSSVAIVIFLALRSNRPSYLSQVGSSVASSSSHRSLCTTSGTDFSVPRTRTRLVDLTFSATEPILWDTLPTPLPLAPRIQS